MSNRKLIATSLAGCLGVTVALACGPDFPWQLLDDRSATLAAVPANSFAFEAAHLITKPTDALEAVELDAIRPADRQEQLATAETGELSAEQAETVAEMRAAATGDEAFARGAAVPAAIRLYTAGAVDFRRDDPTHASARFQAVLRLPAGDQSARAVWASYMLGRIYAQAGDAAKASEAFAGTRALALNGTPDPLGLAVASFGEEARLHLAHAGDYLAGDAVRGTPEAAAGYGREIAAAVALYAEQAARNSGSGVQSLRIVAERLLAEPSRLAASVSDPLTQRLLVAYVLARTGDVPRQIAFGSQQPNAAPDPLLVSLVDAIGPRGLDRAAGADRLAALAYGIGRYDLAESLAAKAPGPLASWVKAKLALQKGDIVAAAAFYAEASKSFPTVDAATALDDGNTRLIAGEGGVLALARGEYTDAMDRLYPLASTYWGDVVHIAERVLTIDELKRFVDAKVPEPSAPATANQTDTDSDTDAANDNSTVSNPAMQLRDLLARRLMRAGRFQDALAYFQDPGVRGQANDFAQALHNAEAGSARIDRARAWYTAARLARQVGMEMMGTEAAPDYFAYDGNFETGIGQDKLDGPFTTAGERARFAASAANPDLRFHYRYVAVDEASHAADLLPPRSQAFAAVLCNAAGWMMSTRGADARVHDLYARYVKQGPYVAWAAHFGRDCPEPDFADAAQAHYLRDARNFVSRFRWPIGILLLASLGLLAAWRVRRRAA